MATPSPEQRIMRDLSRRGTCSFLDLKSAIRLSRGDIEGITDRLVDRRFVRIEKDHLNRHISYTWTGPKEEANPPDHARPKKARKKRIIPTEKKPNSFSPGPEEIEKNWRKISAAALRSIRAKVPIVSWRNHATRFLRNPRMKKAYSLLCAASKDRERAIHVFAEAMCYGIYFNPTRQPGLLPPLADITKVRAMRNRAEDLVRLIRVIPLCQNRSNLSLWGRASTEWAHKEDKRYPIRAISDGHVIDALQVVRDFLSGCIPRPRGRGRPQERDQNHLMSSLEQLFRKHFGRRRLHAVTALFIETVCGGSVTDTEVKTSLARLRKRNRT